MAASREFEGRQRARAHGPWHLLHSHTFEGDMRHGFAVDVWNILDQVMAGPSFRRTQFVPFGLDSDEIWTLVERHRIRNWISSQFPESEGGSEQQTATPVDIKAILAKCRTETFEPRGGGGEEKEEEEELHCPVCLDKFVADQTLLSLPCEHAFHTNCLKPWIESSHGCCPVCRFDILLGTPRARPPVVQARASSSPTRTHIESTIDEIRNIEEIKEEKVEERETTKVEVEVEVKAEAEVEAEVEAEPEIEAKSEVEIEVESESESESEVEVEVEAEAEVRFEEEVHFEEEEVPFMEEWIDFHQRGSDDLMSLFEGLESALDRMGLRG